MERYERRQIGTMPLIVMFVVLAGFAVTPRIPTTAAAMAFAVVVILAFSILRTGVDGDAVRWAFTFGIPGGRIPLTAIESAEITTTNLLEGWGIHWTIWHGWLWNVSGFRAVEIHYGAGKRITLGTDDPQGLLEAIERFRKGAA